MKQTLNKLEQLIGRQLPTDLKDFFVEHCGMDVGGETKIEFGKITSDFTGFCGKIGNYDPLTNDVRILRIGEEDSHYPPGSLILGDDLGGNNYFGVWNGDIYEIRWMGYYEEANSFLVAKSFTEFLEKIEVTPYEE